MNPYFNHYSLLLAGSSAWGIDKPFTWLVILMIAGALLLIIVCGILILTRKSRAKKTGPVNYYQNSASGHNFGTTPPGGSTWGTIASPLLRNQQEFDIAFNRAIYLAQGGYKQEAYQLFKSLEPGRSQDINLLLWIAFTTVYPAEAHQSIATAATIAPSNPDVVQAQTWVKSTLSKT